MFDSCSAFLLNALLPSPSPPLPPSPPSSPSNVLQRRLEFDTVLEDDDGDLAGIRCDCSKKCHTQLSDALLKQRRHEFVQLNPKDRQFRSYVELRALASPLDANELKRKVSTRYAIITCIRCCTLNKSMISTKHHILTCAYAGFMAWMCARDSTSEAPRLDHELGRLYKSRSKTSNSKLQIVVTCAGL